MGKTRYPSKIIPPLNQTVFERQRLFDELNDNQFKPLVWVHGSAGAGKTTLVTSWLKKQKKRFLWYRMDNGNNVSADLFYFLALSAQRNYPKKQLDLPVFTAEYADDVRAFAAVFFRQLFSVLDREHAIVFDNCQEIENDPDFFQVLQIALNDIPEGLQIFCISRNRPNQFFKRLSLVGGLLDINPESLRFTEAESKSFINWLNPEINATFSDAVQNKAGGWAAALVLLSEHGSKDLEKTIPVEYKQQELFDYLMTEILAKMDPEAIDFLAKTAVFNQFTVSMAVSLTKYDGARQFLDSLVNKNFLIDRSADSEPIYAYHPILRELLKTRIQKTLPEHQQEALTYKAIEILVAQEKIEEAMPFYTELKDWDGMKPLLLNHSESLINNGRHQTLITWMETLPNDFLNHDPWLLFWYAEAMKALDPNHSADLFDKCYRQFFTNGDRHGLYKTWQVAVEAVTYSPDGFSLLKVWFRRFHELREHYPTCPEFELKIRFSVTALQALAYYNPDHPELKELLKISEDGFCSVPVKSGQQLMCAELCHYYMLVYEIAKLDVLKPYLVDAVQTPGLRALPRISIAKSISHLYQFHGQGDKGLEYFNMGLEISEKTGITLLKPLINLNLVGCHICRGDMDAAQYHLNEAEQTISSEQRLLNALFHFKKAWVYSLLGQVNSALEHAEHSLELSLKLQDGHGIIYSQGLLTRLYGQTRQWKKAEYTLQLLSEYNRRAPNNFHGLQYHLCDAWLGYLYKNTQRALNGIKQFLTIASHEQIKFFYGWHPDVLSPLCLMAVEYGVAADFALSMLQINGLFPSPPLYFEHWPWPVKIYCFNQFTIEINGQLLKQSGKSQKKILELLLTIIMLGAKDVSSTQVCEVLWPDSEGDMAQQTLDTALFRLRKLIGKSAVLLHDGRITLNSECCWIDVAAYDVSVNELYEAMQINNENPMVIKLMHRVLHLYQGPFLQSLQLSMVDSQQKQRQDQFIRLLEQLIHYFNNEKDRQHIPMLIEQGLERIPRFEPAYQQVMKLYESTLDTSA